MPHTSLNFRHKDGQEVSFIEIYNLPITKPVALPQPRATEHIVVPRELYSYHNENLKVGIGIALGTVALIGLVTGASLLAKNSEARSQTRVSSEVQTSLAEKATLARAEIVAKVSAETQAKLITDQLNKNIAGDTSLINITILNGTIVENAVNLNTGKHITAPLIQDAILLSTAGNQQPDANGKFLNGAWLGVIGPQYTLKKPVVSLFQFDSNGMQFESGNAPTLTVAILTTRVNLIGQGIAYETLAFDAISNTQIFNDNGRPVYVGESLTNKG